ncbi:MAG: GTPase, partial [Candidatus Cloacimonadia bacterium]
IGLVGVSKSGKTTVFNAVTGSNVPVTDYYTQSTKPNIGTVDVVDKRLDYLQKAFNRPKIVYATVEYFDFAGIKKDKSKGKREAFSD